MNWQIAIDGPAGAGKSTIARSVAKRLNFAYVDTGAMYRAVTLKAINLKINMEDEAEYQFLESTAITFENDLIYLDGIDVSREIRSLEVTNSVSLVSKFQYVRDKLVALQRQMGRSKNIIMDGRDIGTVVLPDAKLKIYLEASLEERAKRRMLERMECGDSTHPIEEIIQEIKERDFKDSNRSISPLSKATDAIEIDTSLLSVDAVIETIIRLVMERGYKMENVKTEQDLNVETNVVEATKEEGTEVVETAEPKVKKPRATKKAAEAVVEAAPVEEEKAPKAKAKKAAKEEVVAEEVVEAEEAPKAKTTKKAAKAEEVAEEVKAEAVAEVAEVEMDDEPDNDDEVVAHEADENETEETTETENVRELQLVEGEVLEVYDAKPEERNKNGEVIRKAKEERVLIRLDNGQEGLLFRKDVAEVADDEELNEVFLEGDRVSVIVKRVYPDGGKVLLSTALVKKREQIKTFEEMIKSHGTFTARVVKVIKVGLILEHEGYTCLLPNSQVDIDSKDVAALVGTTLDVAPIRVDYNRIRLIVSHKVAKAIQSRVEKQEFIKSVKVGQIFEGTVKNIESYGAFVEISKNVEGLLHISEIEHNRIVKVEKVLNVGDAVKVQVIKVDKDHIGLSRKALLPNYWKEFIDSHKVDQDIKGTVAEINRAGVVVTLNEHIQGFLPKSEFSWERDTFIEDFVKVSDAIEAKIIELDLNKKRIILSRKRLAANPWETIKLRGGDAVTATVVKVTADGVKVTVNGASGFMPKHNYQTGTEFAEGQQIEAKVRVFDPSKTRLIITMKEDHSLDRHSVNKFLKSQERVTSTFGDFIDLEELRKKRK